KAEVPPPSKFNRRVPEALDRIVLRALARDLPDRYQTALELQNDLVAFMEQYRYQTSEMQEFMRNLFRADYQKAVEETESCRAASLEQEPDLEVVPPAPDSFAARPAPVELPETPGAAPPVTQTLEETGGSQPGKPAAQAKTGSLWSRLREKFTK